MLSDQKNRNGSADRAGLHCRFRYEKRMTLNVIVEKGSDLPMA